MTAALYHLPSGALAALAPGAEVVLDGAEGHHAVTVKRAQVGEVVLLADGSGLVASGRISEVATGMARVEIRSVEDSRPTGPRFVLVQALAKGGRDEQAVEAATELGVDAVLAWQAARSIVRWKAERAEKPLAKWQAVAAAAAKQSRRATTPEVEGPLSTAGLARRVDAAALTLALHEDAVEPLAALELPAAGDVLVVVGPEGGIAPEELDTLVSAGARAVRLGPTVLRSSSAGPAALAVLNAAGRWR
ncbi:16S rRNA (uracil(1498)-N(3))-methyltransferase [Mobilicoccus massiliensis]|uniref:16S rRNA (uracil(1498)-N(3))-methyltransferase n=1 Tax=Mobilicoccus massiliensis TaxID=1522310 RepID=UPI00058B501B|nr:16S rRNA (uracil(1498)-N(3))-methyltransferase [Mobilicoccus massiliensis]